MTCLIVDDEPTARDILEQYVSKTPGLTLLGTCSHAHDAYDTIQRDRPDLLFLDISMPRMTGIELIQRLEDPPSIILTTAYSEYAVESYELDVVDYLLKPFSYDRFLKSIKKVPQNDTVAEDHQDSILVKSDGKWFPCKINEILIIEGQGDYLKIYFSDRHLLVLSTLKEMEKQLPANQFLRVHKSYIIQRSHIDYVEGNQVVIGAKFIPIGKSYRESFFNIFRIK